MCWNFVVGDPQSPEVRLVPVVDVRVDADALAVVLTPLDLGHRFAGIAEVERHNIVVGRNYIISPYVYGTHPQGRESGRFSGARQPQMVGKGPVSGLWVHPPAEQ